MSLRAAPAARFRTYLVTPRSPRPALPRSPHEYLPAPSQRAQKERGGCVGEIRKERGGSAENPRIIGSINDRCLNRGEKFWRVQSQIARVVAVSTRVGLISARVRFLLPPYFSLSQVIEKKEKERAGKKEKRAYAGARVGARVLFQVRGLGSTARVNPRTSAQFNSLKKHRHKSVVQGGARMRGLRCHRSSFVWRDRRVLLWM